MKTFLIRFSFLYVLLIGGYSPLHASRSCIDHSSIDASQDPRATAKEKNLDSAGLNRLVWRNCAVEDLIINPASSDRKNKAVKIYATEVKEKEEEDESESISFRKNLKNNICFTTIFCTPATGLFFASNKNLRRGSTHISSTSSRYLLLQVFRI